MPTLWDRIRLKTGGFRSNGRIVAGLPIDEQIKRMHANGEVRISVTPHGVRVRRTKKGIRLARLRLRRAGL